MRLAYKYRLYPNKSQIKSLNYILDVCKWVYNETLRAREDAYKINGKSLSLYDTNKLLIEWKEQHQSLNDVYSHILQQTQVRVDDAFRHFFRRVKLAENPGYPKYKDEEYKSFTYKEIWSGFRFTEDGKLRLSKIGDIKIKLHRPIEGKVKTLTIIKNKSGQWFAVFSVEINKTPQIPLTSIVGIDLGIKNYIVTSDGQYFDNPKFIKQSADRIKTLDRQMKNAEPKRYEKKKWQRAREYERLTNRRKDFHDKLANYFIDNYQVIVVEDLNIEEMKQDNCRIMSRYISDAGWGQFILKLKYKAELKGRTIIEVDPKNTTKTCSNCGNLQNMELNDRIYICGECDFEIDRDLNSAINILSRGLTTLG